MSISLDCKQRQLTSNSTGTPPVPATAALTAKFPSLLFVEIKISKNLLVEVTRKMGTTWHNPVLRHDLRVEARKRIGNLGVIRSFSQTHGGYGRC
jgi:hypothetical protein